MPELPEVETTKNGIKPYVEGEFIEEIHVHQPKLRWPISREISSMKHARVVDLKRRAKYLLIETDQGILIVHLGMSGSLRIVEKDLPLQKHDHVDVLLSTGKRLRYNDPRRFGSWLWCINETALENIPQLANLGLEPLSDAFNTEYLYQKTRKRAVAIKNLIMQNPVVVGVGNIYANEALFASRIHPQTISSQLTRQQCEQLVSVIKVILTQAIEQGGTTLKDFVQPDGKPGYFAQTLHVYGRKGLACTKCGHLIEVVQIGQRTTFFCPTCQS